MPVTRHPPHRSWRAARPYRAPASGGDAQAWRGIRMQGMGCGPPVLGEGVQARPWHTVALPASAQRRTPRTPEGVAAYGEQAPMARHGRVSRVPQPHAFPPGPRRRDGPGQAPPPRLLPGLQCLADPLRQRRAPDGTLPVPRLTAWRRQAETGAGRRCALRPPLAPFDRQAPALATPRLLRGPYPIALPTAFLQVAPAPYGGVLLCAAHQKIGGGARLCENSPLKV